jgi:spore germination cell wall hydrolase CwlJ-like protein
MCDGKPEDRYELCRTKSGDLTSYWRHKCDMRWEQVTMIAKAVMSETDDPTNGAVLYYAAWLPKAPDWAVDMKTNTILAIGNHIFACSTKRGDDVCPT